MNSDNFDSAFFAAEYAAQAAAENTVEELYRRAGANQKGLATAVVVATGIAVVAAWKSPLGRKVRNKIAEAIKAE